MSIPSKRALVAAALAFLASPGAQGFSTRRMPVQRIVTLSAVSKKEARKKVMAKENFIRSPNKFKEQKEAVDKMMLDEFKVKFFTLVI